MIFQLTIPSTDLKFKVEQYQESLLNVPELVSGVYCFYSHTNDPLYVGKSIKLKSRLIAHISGQTHTKDFYDIFFYVKVWFIKEPTDIEMIETYLINHLKPVYNKNKLFNTNKIYNKNIHQLYENQYGWINETPIKGLSQSEMMLLSYLKEVLMKEFKEREYVYRNSVSELKKDYNESQRDFKENLNKYVKEEIDYYNQEIKQYISKYILEYLNREFNKFHQIEEKVVWVTHELDFLLEDLQIYKNDVESCLEAYKTINVQLKNKTFKNIVKHIIMKLKRLALLIL
jgi:hypothetical protein